MMKQPITVVALLAAGMLAGGVSGCTTIVWGSTQDVEISSEPSGADVYVSGKHKGKTPLEVEVPRDEGFLNIVLKKEGYADTRVDLKSASNPWTIPAMWLSYFWFAVGFATDVRSDASMRYESEISVPLLTEEDSAPRSFYDGKVVVRKAEDYR